MYQVGTSIRAFRLNVSDAFLIGEKYLSLALAHAELSSIPLTLVAL